MAEPGAKRLAMRESIRVFPHKAVEDSPIGAMRLAP